jgi:outer membrane protein assembly factor BamB
MKLSINNLKYKLLVVILVVLSIALIIKLQIVTSPARSIFNGDTVLVKGKVEKGYLLFSPLLAKSYATSTGKIYLTELNGKIVHIWETKYSTLYSMVTPQGELYTSQVTPSDLAVAPGGGKTGLLQKLNIHGDVIWEFRDEMLHHDFDVDLDSDTVYAIKFTPVRKSFSDRIKGGNATKSENYWSDTIIQIDKFSNIVWSWELQNNLKPEDYILDTVTPRTEWSHSNSIKFYKTNPINNKPALLLSAKHLNAIFLIDRETGKVIWESPKGIFSYQHDATLTSSGTVLIFDNGTARKQDRQFMWSRLLEIDIRTNKIVWQFKGGQTGPEIAAFFSSIMGGVQRLSNGSTLGVDSLKGHIFEVTQEGKVVFSFVNPYLTTDHTSPFGNNLIFKARKIPLDYFNDDIKFRKNIF